MSKLAFAAALLLLSGACPLALQALDQPQSSRLEEIKLQVDVETQKLKELEQKVVSIEKDVKLKQGEVMRLRDQETKIKTELQVLLQKKALLEEEMRVSQEKIDRLKRYSLARVRAAYMNKPARVFEMLLTSDNLDRSRQAFFLRKIQQADLIAIQELLLLIEKNSQGKIELEKILTQQQKLSEQAAEKRGALERVVLSLKKSNEDLKNQKNLIGEGLTALKAESLRLETVVVSLTGGDLEQRELEKKKEKTEKSRPQPGLNQESFEGKGLFRQKGALLLPVNGKIIQPFGKHKVKEFSDFIFSKGVEYEANPGSEVKAIADGKVIYVGRMPGYGTIAILDHGERYYSLYGRLGQVSAELGQVLSKSDVLGLCGDKDDKKRNFYFEIRRSGVAVNPQDYYRRLS